MDLTNTPLTTPTRPEIELDGGYAYCRRCYAEVEPSDHICPKCNQTQDWSWFGKLSKNKRKQETK